MKSTIHKNVNVLLCVYQDLLYSFMFFSVINFFKNKS